MPREEGTRTVKEELRPCKDPLLSVSMATPLVHLEESTYFLTMEFDSRKKSMKFPATSPFAKACRRTHARRGIDRKGRRNIGRDLSCTPALVENYLVCWYHCYPL